MYVCWCVQVGVYEFVSWGVDCNSLGYIRMKLYLILNLDIQVLLSGVPKITCFFTCLLFCETQSLPSKLKIPYKESRVIKYK